MRIIAGTLRGHRLRAPRGQHTRPTPDRVREALFAALGAVSGARVLDLYAGTGALALEALSRGAEHAVLVERAPTALAALRDNIRRLKLGDRTTVLAADVRRVIGPVTAAGPYDLVFADPPYADVENSSAVATLERLLSRCPTPTDGGRRVLAPEGRVVLEHAARNDAPSLRDLERGATRRYGDTALSWYEAATPE
jgi:16S rRNA (guanine966-N2)-methyltransferase